MRMRKMASEVNMTKWGSYLDHNSGTWRAYMKQARLTGHCQSANLAEDEGTAESEWREAVKILEDISDYDVVRAASVQVMAKRDRAERDRLEKKAVAEAAKEQRQRNTHPNRRIRNMAKAIAGPKAPPLCVAVDKIR